MTQAAAPQQPAQQTYRARVYQAASGEWAWSIDLAGDPFARGAGFESGEDAECNLYEHLPRPYSLILDHDPDSGVHYGPVRMVSRFRPRPAPSAVVLAISTALLSARTASVMAKCSSLMTSSLSNEPPRCHYLLAAGLRLGSHGPFTGSRL